jgi:hypothetical protein
MKHVIAAAAAFAAVALSGSNATASNDLLDRMAGLNPNLHSFTATMHAGVALKTFPFLNVQLEGTYYHKEPDQNKVVFTSGVPAVAEQFDKLYAHIEPPSRWRDVYDVKIVSDDGSTTTFRLVPRKHGNVDHVDARADDKTATVASMRWNYDNGGYAEMNNRYGQVDGNVVVTSQTGHVQEPGYTADINSTIDGYKINAALPDGIFTQ